MYRVVAVWVLISILCCYRIAAFLAKASPQSFTSKCELYIDPASTPLIKRIHNYTYSHMYDLPSPHRELILGMVLGYDIIKCNSHTYQMLKKTGTVHAIVVSGYNLGLIATFLENLFGKTYTKCRLLSLLLLLFSFSIVSGAQPPVIRALSMATLKYITQFYGVRPSTIQLVAISGVFALIVFPNYSVSLSFMLSLLATLSLVMFGDIVGKIMPGRARPLSSISETAAAQVLVWPVISYNFGTVSVVSILVNPLVTFAIPIITMLGFLYLPLLFVTNFIPLVINGILLRYILLPVFLPLEYFSTLVIFFGMWRYSSINYSISTPLAFTYYSLCIFVYIYVSFKKCIKNKRNL